MKGVVVYRGDDILPPADDVSKIANHPGLEMQSQSRCNSTLVFELTSPVAEFELMLKTLEGKWLFTPSRTYRTS